MPTILVNQYTGTPFAGDFGTFDSVFPFSSPVGFSSTTVTLVSDVDPTRITVLKGTGFTFLASGDPVAGTLTSIDFFEGPTLIADMSGFAFNLTDFAFAIEQNSLGNDVPFNTLLDPFDVVFDASTVSSEETVFLDSFSPQGDTAIAGAGGSYMALGEFADTYVAGTGFDQISFVLEFGLFGATVNLGTGQISDTYGNVETLVTSAGKTFESLRGSFNDDTLIGDGERNQFRGLDGEDFIDGGGGRDLVRYDRDLNYFGTGGVDVNLSENFGRDGFGDIDALFNIEDVYGTNFDDEIDGDDGDNELRGLDGSDRLYGDAGNDILNPGDNDGGFDLLELSEGNDTYVFSDANLNNAYYAISAEEADVTITFNIDGVNNTGTIDKGIYGFDTLTDIERPLIAGFTAGGLELIGGDAGDIYNLALDATAHWMRIVSSAGDDVLNITGGDVVLDYARVSTGGINANLAVGLITGDAVEVGTDQINGSVWEVRGTASDDVFIGSTSDESFRGNGGNDYFDGGGGFDRVRYDNSGIDALFIDLNTGLAVGTRGGTNFVDTLVDIERVRGSEQADAILGSGAAERFEGRDGSDVLEGRGGDDLLQGEGGNDVLIGGTGNDTLQGGIGDDLLYGNAGDDVLDGGDGFDTVSYENASGRVVVRLNQTADIGSDEGTDTFISIENVIGGRFNDRITGDAGNNVLSGGQGNDVIVGLAGDDILDGDIGNDELIGSGGADTISGGNGFDILDGQGGADTLDGGSGDDTITAGAGIDFVNGGGGSDTIFGNAGTDTIFGDNGADTIRGGTGGDEIDGGAGNDALYGGKGNDTIFGGDGTNTLYGGNGPASGDGKRDTFVFKSAALGGTNGVDTIFDFEDGTDKLDLTLSGYTSFADVLADATDVGANMQIDWDFGGVLVIENFSVAQFNDGDVFGLL